MTKTALITGTTSGFGLATARRFGREGWKLVLTGRRQERLEQVQAELAPHCETLILALDVQDTAAVIEALDALPKAFSDVHALVNNAGLALGTGPAHEASLEDWHTMIDTNIKGLTTVTRTLLPALVRNGRGASIINIGSVAGRWPYPGGNTYCGTKAFVEQFSLALRSDLLGTGVRVSCLSPGMSESEFTLVRTGGDRKAYDRLYQGVEPIQPEDIADTVYWLATLPAHLNVNSLEIMPVRQAWSPFAIHRESEKK